MIRIAIDVYGGDLAPYSVIKGLNLFIQENKQVEFLLFGDESSIIAELNLLPNLKSYCRIFDTKFFVKPDDKPAYALRNGKETSMWKAIEAVKDNQADVIVSGGNTGALMVISKFLLRTLPGIARPAIIGTLPNNIGNSVMLDLGANSDCDAEIIFQFAIMGRAFAKSVLAVSEPKIGLLNIGTEEIKGNDSIRLASVMIKDHIELGKNFHGFIEGNDIARGIVDVIVTDGFSGNIALKSIEGTAWLFANFLKKAGSNSFLAKLGFFLASSSIKKIFKKFDKRLYNGAMFLGLNGIVIKSHGSADEMAFANAIKIGHNLAMNKINQQIMSDLSDDLNLVRE